jgi:hypothetical protein
LDGLIADFRMAERILKLLYVPAINLCQIWMRTHGSSRRREAFFNLDSATLEVIESLLQRPALLT